jgi:cytochrome P450
MRHFEPKPDAAERVVEISSSVGVGDAWRCPALTTVIDGPFHQHFHTGTVNHLDGHDHVARRRAMGSLLKRRGHRYFRDSYLFPTADAALEDVLAHPDPDGYCRIEILSWAQQVNQRLAAGLTGFDGATGAAGGRRLFALMEAYLRGRPSNISVVTGAYDPASDQAQEALRARDELIASYYEPSLHRRQQLLAEVEAGTRDEATLPQDMLMLIARRLDPAWADEGNARRDAISLLAASVKTTSLMLVWTLREVFDLADHDPGFTPGLVDDQIALRLVQEAMRLHPAIPAFPRGALDSVHLKDGTEIEAGSLAVIRSGPANVAPEVFGESRLEFDPNRPVPDGVARHGYAFGAGPHMCYGMPIVMGAEGIDGSIVYLLKQLLQAGAEPDPDYPPRYADLAATRGWYAEPTGAAPFHLRFPARPR